MAAYNNSPTREIIRYAFTGQWTWEDLGEAREQEHALMTSVNHPVDVIVDLSASTMIPHNPVSHFKRFATTAPDNANMTVIVSSNSFAEALVNIFRRLYNRPAVQLVQMAPTLADAEAVIAGARAKIPE